MDKFIKEIKSLLLKFEQDENLNEKSIDEFHSFLFKYLFLVIDKNEKKIWVAFSVDSYPDFVAMLTLGIFNLCVECNVEFSLSEAFYIGEDGEMLIGTEAKRSFESWMKKTFGNKSEENDSCGSPINNLII